MFSAVLGSVNISFFALGLNLDLKPMFSAVLGSVAIRFFALGFNLDLKPMKRSGTIRNHQEPIRNHQEPSGRCQEPSGTHQEPSGISQLAKLANYSKVAPPGRTCSEFGVKIFLTPPGNYCFYLRSHLKKKITMGTSHRGNHQFRCFRKVISGFKKCG